MKDSCWLLARLVTRASFPHCWLLAKTKKQ